MDRILVDSSAWIHFFNKTSLHHFDAVADALRKDRAVTCGLIVIEVVQGARSERERRLLVEYLRVLDYVELHRDDYASAATLGFSLRRKGVTIKTVDLLLIHLAVREELVILHDDSDFEFAARHTSLRVTNPE